MNINAEKRFLAIVLAVLMMFSVLPVTSFAAGSREENGTLLEGRIDWTAVIPTESATKDLGSVSAEGDTITLTAQAEAVYDECNSKYNYNKKYTELTLTNKLSVEAVISFSFNPVGTIEIDGTEYVAADNFSSASLAVGDSVKVRLASPESGKDKVGDISSAVLSGISIIENITRDMSFAPAANGTITVDGATVSSNITKSVAYANGVNVTATPKSGYKFLAWTDQNNTVLSTVQSANLRPVRDGMIVSAKFVPVAETGHWLAGNKIWTDLDEALNAAASGDKTVKLMDNATLKKSYTIPAGITVSVPFNQALTTYGPNPEVLQSPNTAPAAKLYCTLTLDKNVTLTVYGGLEVSANHLAAHGGKTQGGRPYEYYSMIRMGENAHIDIQSGGKLYAWGYIVGADSAKVTANSGATVYEKMQITDYRGGGITSIIVLAEVFPFNQYYVQNVEVAEVLHSGATLVCHAGLYMKEVTTASVNFIGGTDAMFGIGAGATVVKKYDNANDRLLIDINGNASMNPISLMGYNTANFILPVNHNITVNVNSGMLEMNQDILMQPGAEVNVGREAYVQFTSGKKVYLMDTQDWGNYCFGAKLRPVSYVPLKNAAPGIRTEANMTDARININGVAVVAGQMYASTNGALIESSGKTGVVVLLNNAPGSTTNIKQSPITSSSDAGNAVKYISVGAASLTNADGTKVDTKGAGQYTTYVYDSILDKWVTTAINITPTLTFDANGGFMDSAKTSTTETVTVDYQNTALAFQPLSFAVTGTVPVRDGYTFADKWNTAADGSGKDFTYTDYLTISQNHTLYAVWEKNAPATYAITWNVDGTPVTMDVEADTVPVYPNGTPAKTSDQQKHYTFSGWATTKNGTVLDTLPAVSEDVTYYAVFTAENHADTDKKAVDGKHYCDTCNQIMYSCIDAANDGDHLCDYGCKSVMGECSGGTATCKIQATCTECGQPYGPLADHEEKTKEENRVDATCDKAGSYDTVVYCTVCNKELGRTTTEIEKLGHSPAKAVNEKVVNATCEAEGSYDEVVYCSVCNAELSRENKTTPSTGHKWNEAKYIWSEDGKTCTATRTCATDGSHTETAPAEITEKITTSATCTAMGKTTYTASFDVEWAEDGRTKTVEDVAALGHNMKETAAKVEPTCETAGKEAVYTCANNCGKTEGGEEIAALGHDMKETAAKVEPTCETAGKEAVFTCANNCGKTTGGEEIAATGHDMKESAAKVEPTCEKAGKEAVYTCANNCGKTEGGEEIAALGHDMKETAAKVEPTCEDAGKEAVYTCANNCGKTEGGEEIAATGHDMKESAAKVEPTCEDAGKEAVYTCANNCGKTEGGEEIAALGHDMKETAAKVEPTCETTGKTAVYTCANNCGKTEGGEEIAALGHSFTNYVSDNNASCTEDGTKTAKCDRCDATDTIADEDSALGHSPAKAVNEKVVNATCEAEGSYDEVVYCSVCNAELSRENKTTPSTGHKWNEAEYIWSEDGKTCTAIRTCATDENHNEKATAEITEKITTPATCTAMGKTTYTASFKVDWAEDGQTKTVEDVAALGHDMKETAAKVEPTCEDAGKEAVYSCANNCGKTEGGEEIAALGHEMKENAAKVDPTCETTGKEAVYTCANNCGKTEGGEEIAALGHDMKESAAKVEPTCEDAGKEAVYTCANGCGKITGGEEIAALGHDMKESAAKVEPTCETTGKTAVYTCANNCGKTTGGEEIAALGHDMKESAAKVEPTCETAGKEAVYTCANNCGKTEGGEEIAALGHGTKTGFTYTDLDDGKHSVTCNDCGAALESADHVYDENTHICVCKKVETFTLTVKYIVSYDTREELEAQVPFGANIYEVLGGLSEIRYKANDVVDVDEPAFKGQLIIQNWHYYDETSTMPAEDIEIEQAYGEIGWKYSDEGATYFDGGSYCIGWNYIEEDFDDIEGGAWYYFATADENSDRGFRVEGISRVPYPTEEIDGVNYGPDQETIDYCASKGTEFIDEKEAWFVFDENGKFRSDLTGFVTYDNENRYVEKGFLTWNPGFVEVDGELYYFIGDEAIGGNIAADGDTYIIRPNGVDGFTKGDAYYFVNGQLGDIDGIVDGKYYVDSKLMFNNGLTKYGNEYIYVRATGAVVANGVYWIAANTFNIVPGLYHFDANGYMLDVKTTEKNGVCFEDGKYYYYVDGVKEYAGLIQYTGTANNGTVYENDWIYVRSNGELATKPYWTTKNNEDVSGMKAAMYNFTNTGKMVVTTGIVEEDGKLFYYVLGVKQECLGLIKLGENYYYVRTSGELVRNCTYWITNVNDTGVIAKAYEFDNDGVMLNPAFTATEGELEGVIDGYFYKDGKIAYGAGLVELDDGSIIYVRSNGQLATGVYWPTNLNGVLPAGRYDFGTDGRLVVA